MRFIRCSAVADVAGLQRALQPVELVQQLLEPELVDLVDDDEEHLVVLGPVGQRRLQLEQLVDAQVGACR